MRKASLLTTIVLLGSVVGVGAQQPAAAVGAVDKPPRIAVIDWERITADSQLGKAYAARLETLNNDVKSDVGKKQAELDKKDAEIKALQDELQKQGAVLSEDALEAKQADLVKKNRAREAFFQDGQQELQRKQAGLQRQMQALNNEFQQKVRPHVEAVVKERGIDILLVSGAVAFAGDAFDVSPDVIKRADEAERSAKPAAPAKR